MVAKKFQLPYTAIILLPLKLQKIDCATRSLEHSLSLPYSEEELFNSLNKTDIATFVIQLCNQYFQKLNKLNLLQAKSTKF